ncbi:MAG: HsmA family protein [Clostridium perfringens]|nr:HsmA family protein [Clostridium perfringens]
MKFYSNYTIGVWSEHRAGILKKKHVIIFWCGLVCDTLGTYTMSRIVAAGTDKGITPTDLLIHQSTGMLAIILMLIHSLVVWFIWLIPYFVGMYIGMTS